jgi:protein phosphatase
VREENAIAALEVMSRYAANPKWLIYLPPTMSPTETHPDGVEAPSEGPVLEHPEEAFTYYLHEGVPRVVCEEKHMGSRAVVVVCRDEDAARRRFGVMGEGIGICYTRTGRRFFDDIQTETVLLARLRAALDTAAFWDEFQTDWFCLDCELLPWSAKAQELLRTQYAAVGAAARTGLSHAVQALRQASVRGVAQEQLAEYEARAGMADRFVDAYRRYCWPVHGVEDYKLAPFHLLASQGAVHVNRDHVWHMHTLARLCQADPAILRPTRHQVVDVTDAASRAEGVDWWTALTGSGGEGMVVKPFDFIVKGRRGLVQPGVKCRGREYLRIIYGPEYTAPQHMARLRARGLMVKRSLALREFALGVESLERFVRGEPLYRVHECVFAVLALESEPADPRL